MPADLQIRDARRGDFTAWRALWDGYNAFYGRAGKSALSEDITRTTWERFFDAAEPMHALIAESSGTMLGIAHFLYHRSTIYTLPICYLQDLYTLESARGKGVGRALIEVVYERAKQAGAARVYWQTHETNTVAMRLYDKVADKSGFLVYRHTL